MKNSRINSGFVLLAMSQFALVVLAILLVWILDIPLAESRYSTTSAFALGVVLALATFITFGLLYRFGGRFSQSLLGDIHRVSAIFSGCSWWHLAFVAALAGVGEELLFRGFLQTWLGQYVSIVAAILISSFVFGLLHYLSHAYFICATLMSVAFGAGYYVSGSMPMVMVWHGVYDFIALLVIVKFPQLFRIHLAPNNKI